MRKCNVMSLRGLNKQKIHLVAIQLFTLLLAILSSCGSDNSENEDLYGRIVNDRIPTQLVEKDLLPEWLVSLIDEAEATVVTTPAGSRPSRIYQLLWQGKKYYMHYDAYNSYIFYDVYTEGGQHVEWDVYDSSDFNKNSTDWICIYIIRE